MNSLEETYRKQDRRSVYERIDNTGVFGLIIANFILFTGILFASTELFIQLFQISIDRSLQIGGILGGISVILFYISSKTLIDTIEQSYLLTSVAILFMVSGIIHFSVNYPSTWQLSSWASIFTTSILFFTGFLIAVADTAHTYLGIRPEAPPKKTVEYFGNRINKKFSLADVDDSDVEKVLSSLQDDNKRIYIEEKETAEETDDEITHSSIGLIGSSNKYSTEYSDD